MSDFTFALITPSYAPDFQRCKLLCWTIKKFIASPIRHYIVVDQKDRALFQELADDRTIILTKEEILPSGIKRVPFFDKKNIWLNFKGRSPRTLLLRGWLIQQIIKLAAAQYATEDVLVFVDSDVAFIDHFDLQSFVQGDRVRLFRVDHQTDHEGDGIGKRWKDTAKQLLGLPPDLKCYDFYVSQIVTWRRDTLLKLYDQIEKVTGQDWLSALAGVTDLSEYALYGVFANYVLGEAAGHYDNHLQKVCWCYWEDVPMTTEALHQFFEKARASDHKAVMISAKSGMDLSIAEFQTLLGKDASYEHV
jgi:hypothetical protein